MNKKIKNYGYLQADVCNLYIYDDIPEIEDGFYQNTPFQVLDELANARGVRQLNVYINSWGGSVKTGFNIINVINRYKEEQGAICTVYLDGVAASMAGVIAVAVADKIICYANSLLMIHLPMTMAGGNKNDMMDALQALEQAEARLKSVFEAKATEALTPERLSQIMEAETWLNPTEMAELFQTPIEFKDYANNTTILNAIDYEARKVPSEKLGFIIDEKLKQVMHLVIDNK